MRYYQAQNQPYVSSYVGNKYNPDLYLKAGAMLEDRLNQAEAANAKFQETGELTPGYYTGEEAKIFNEKTKQFKQQAEQAALAGKTNELRDAILKGQAHLNSGQASKIKQDYEDTNKYLTPELIKPGKKLVVGEGKYKPEMSSIPKEFYGLHKDTYQGEVMDWGKNYFRPDKIKEAAPYLEEITDEAGNITGYKSGVNTISYEDASKEAFQNALVPTVETWGADLNNYADFTGLGYRQNDQYKEYSSEPGSAGNSQHPEWSAKQQAAFNDASAYMEPLYQEVRTIGSTQNIKTPGADKTGSQKLDGLFSLFGGAHVPLKAPEKAEAVIGAVADGMTGNKEIVGNNVEIVTQTIQGLTETPVSIGEHTLTSQDFYNKLLNSPDGQAVLSGQVTPESEDFLKSLWTSSAPFDYNVAKDMFMQTASEATNNMEQAMTYSTIKDDVINAQKVKTPELFDASGEFKNPITKEEEKALRKKYTSTTRGGALGSPGSNISVSETFNLEGYNKAYNELLQKKNPALKAVNERLEITFGNYSDFVTNAYSINDFPKADGGSINALNFAAQINTRDFLTSGEGGFDLKDFNSLTPIDIEKEYEGKNVRFDPETIYLNSKGKWITSGTLYDETDKNNPVILNEHAIGNVTNVLKGSVLSPTLEVAGNVYGKIKDNLHAVQEGGEFSFTQNGHKVSVKKGPKTGLEDTMYYSIDNGAYNKEASIFDASHVIGIVTSGASEEVAPGGKLQMKVLQEP